MDLWRKYLLNSVALRAPRGRVADALQDDPELEADDEPVTDDTDEADDELPEDEQEDEVDPPEDDPEPEPQPRSRAKARIEALSAEKRALRAEIEASNARLAALEARMTAPQPAQVDPREEEARLALMSPEERMQYRVDQSLARNNQATSQLLGSLQDQTDQTAFRALIRDKPQFSKLAPKVEAKLAELRKKGTPLPREAILIYLIGEQAYGSQEKPRKKAQSQQRMQQQETRPPSGRGDVAGNRRQAAGTTSNLERRLSNVRI